MTFPVFIRVGPWLLHPHATFEVLAYVVGFSIYLWIRRQAGDIVAHDVRWSIVAAAIVGGALGSRILTAFEQPGQALLRWREPLAVFGGKTVVGGLIGGVLAVEWTKRRMGLHVRTGDLFAIPLAVGIAIGRIGCFLTGLSDGTSGNPTTLWLGVDFGDGIPRHPTQMYEVMFLLALTVVLAIETRYFRGPGARFRAFMLAYLGFRLAVDTLKPDPALGFGLSSVQWACLAMLAYYFRDTRAWLGEVWANHE
jgi:phosphatidylglycerol:prolipoprotein diacylglycerol transferase